MLGDYVHNSMIINVTDEDQILQQTAAPLPEYMQWADNSAVCKLSLTKSMSYKQHSKLIMHTRFHCSLSEMVEAVLF